MLSCIQLFATPWTVTHQAPLSVGFSRQEYWGGLPFPSPGNLSDPGIKSVSLLSSTLAGGFFTTKLPFCSSLSLFSQVQNIEQKSDIPYNLISSFQLWSTGNSPQYSNGLDGKRIYEGVDVCICIIDSLGCTPETNRAL